jgi:hypothetical protein
VERLVEESNQEMRENIKEGLPNSTDHGRKLYCNISVGF